MKVRRWAGESGSRKAFSAEGIYPFWNQGEYAPSRNLPGTSEARVPDATRNVRRRACRGSQGLLHSGYART